MIPEVVIFGAEFLAAVNQESRCTFDKEYRGPLAPVGLPRERSLLHGNCRYQSLKRRRKKQKSSEKSPEKSLKKIDDETLLNQLPSYLK